MVPKKNYENELEILIKLNKLKIKRIKVGDLAPFQVFRTRARPGNFRDSTTTLTIIDNIAPDKYFYSIVILYDANQGYFN